VFGARPQTLGDAIDKQIRDLTAVRQLTEEIQLVGID
jgi:hypothetical protein